MQVWDHFMKSCATDPARRAMVLDNLAAVMRDPERSEQLYRSATTPQAVRESVRTATRLGDPVTHPSATH